jgi:hypothetical protein
MLVLILSVIVQIALIVHVVRTGRPTYWIFILLIAPGIGSLAYAIVELLPGLSGNYRARSAVRGVRKTLDPGGDLRRLEQQHKMSGSVDATRHLAGELMEAGRFQDAIVHYEDALNGLYEQDPDLLLGLATAQFANEQFEAARQTLDRLKEHNPDYRSSVGHLIYARSAEACGDLDIAREEYAAVVAYFAGAEARLRYGRFLESQGDNDDAQAEYEEIITAADLAPRHYRVAQKQWINEAKEGIRRLSDS